MSSPITSSAGRYWSWSIMYLNHRWSSHSSTMGAAVSHGNAASRRSSFPASWICYSTSCSIALPRAAFRVTARVYSASACESPLVSRAKPCTLLGHGAGGAGHVQGMFSHLSSLWENPALSGQAAVLVLVHPSAAL